MDKLDTFVLVRFSRRTGKIDTSMEGIGSALLRFWALQHTTRTKDCIIFSKTTGEVVFYTAGTDTGFPHIEDKNLGHIDEYCPELLATVQANNK